MPKERSINPAQAQRKADKAKAIKKGHSNPLAPSPAISIKHLIRRLTPASGKAEVATRRNEKLARRNPLRLQKQLDELKALESSGGILTSHEKTLLESLERDLKAVTKAREALGDAAPKFGREGGNRERGEGSNRGARGGGVLGKRRRDGEEESSDDDVPEDVKRIPMPRDTPPPIPKSVLDEWYQKRRERLGITRNQNWERGAGTSANNMPLGANERKFGNGGGNDVPERPMPKVEAKTVYEAKPVIRDLRKEAVSFVPAAVRAKLDKSKGIGGLVEPEEADLLEKAGYMGVKSGSAEKTVKSEEPTAQQKGKAVQMEEVEDEG